jgi:hypothetical protein
MSDPVDIISGGIPYPLIASVKRCDSYALGLL